MQIWISQDKSQNVGHKETAIALGNFDGLHIAHMTIIREAIAYAKQHDMLSMVYTFQKNSKNVVASCSVAKMITTLEQKEAILQKTDLSILYMQEFTESLMKKTPEEFIAGLKDKFHVAFISVGYNYRFGYQAKGDIVLLKMLCEKYNILLHVTQPIYWKNEIVSSSRIRTAIEEGKIENANAMLGRTYFVTGRVKHGNKIGTQMGFPTINTPVEQLSVVPKFGVYITHTYIDGKQYKSVTNVGIKPTIGTNELTIETYIIDFKKDLYGKNIQVDFLKWTRGEIKFPSFEALKEQISHDANEARCYVSHEAEKNYI